MTLLGAFALMLYVHAPLALVTLGGPAADRLGCRAATAAG
jgi:hypothetical protein